MSATRVAVLDCDGVLLDFTGHMLKSVGSPLALADVTQWDVFALMDPEHKRAAHALLEEPDWWLTQPAIEGAQAGVERLRTLGFDVRFATSPWFSCRSWEWARRSTLAMLFGVHPAHVFSMSEKGLLGGDLFIDDKFEHVRDWYAGSRMHNAGQRAVLFDAPYNAKAEWPTRMKGWDDLERILAASGLL